MRSSNGAYQWHTFYGCTGYDSGNGIAVNSSGSIFVVGESNDTWGMSPTNPCIGNLDIVVMELSGEGTYQWHTFHGSSFPDYGNAIALDGDGYIIVAGMSYASWKGPSGQNPQDPFAGGTDAVVIKLIR